MNKIELTKQINAFSPYPATADALKAYINSKPSVLPEDKTWFTSHLPAGTYQNAKAVFTALGL